MCNTCQNSDANLDDFQRWLVGRGYNVVNDTPLEPHEALVWLADQDRQKHLELKAWRKFIRNGTKRAFIPQSLHGDIGDFLAVELESDLGREGLDAIFQVAADRVDQKAIQATRLDFEMAFEDVLTEARAGNLTKRKFKTAIRSIIKRYGRKAYDDGLTDGGVDPAEITSEDLETVNDLIQRQSVYVTAFADVLYGDGISDAVATQKPIMWFNRSIMPFYQNGVVSARANMMVEWVLGTTEEHCDSCLALDGQRHRMKTFQRAGFLPQSNGHKELICKGYHCDCKLLPTTGKARGKLKTVPHD